MHNLTEEDILELLKIHPDLKIPKKKHDPSEYAELHEDLRQLIRGGYDLQKLRIMVGNRICAVMKQKLGIDLTESVEKQDKKKNDFLIKIREEYKRLTDGLLEYEQLTKKRFDKRKIPGGVISKYSEGILIQSYEELLKTETKQFNNIEAIVDEHPLWTQYLKHIDGVGFRTCAILISEINIYESQYASSLCMYSGIDTVKDEETGIYEGRTKKKKHQVDVKYIDKDGNVDTKKSITYNPFLKSKLLGVIGPNFLRISSCPYRVHYDNYKNRLNHQNDARLRYDKWKKDNNITDDDNDHPLYIHPRHKRTKGHIHKMAIRYMIKIFLQELYPVWRKMENLPVALPYHEAVLGMKHGVASEEKDAVRMASHKSS